MVKGGLQRVGMIVVARGGGDLAGGTAWQRSEGLHDVRCSVAGVAGVAGG